MILRKPYAFLIKHFRKINLALLILVIYIFIQTLSLQGYTQDYARSNTNVIDSISAILSSSYFFILILIIAITILLLILLKRKDKPIKTYVIILIEYIIFLILSIYLSNHFHDVLLEGYDLALARTIQGLVLVASLPQYVVILLLVIRTIGLDLNSFGFKQDKDLLADEEDREEVEVEVEFDKDKFKRNAKKTIRTIKYFIIEHKVQVIIMSSIVLVIASIFIYRNVYLMRKIYKMDQNISSNYYTFNVQNSYITTKDYRGDIVNEGKSYVIVDLDIKNEVSSTRDFDASKFILYVDEDYYVPTINYNKYFADLGPVYKNQNIAANAQENFFLIYEIKTPKEDSEFLLRYQDVTENYRLIRIKLQIKDISNFIVKDTKNITESMSIPINEQETLKFLIPSYEIGTNFTYTYESCVLNNCPVYTDTTNPNSNRLVLYMKVNPFETNVQNLIDYFVKYGKMRYIINDKQYTENLKNAISKKYRGNYLYIDVNSQIQSATSVEMVFTIRNNQYIYKIK